MKTVNEIKPDIVHVQYDAGLYGLQIDPRNPSNTKTYIDSFYYRCREIPIVTTFHSGFSLSQWLNLATLVKKHGRIGKSGIPLRYIARLWKYFWSYQAFKKLNIQKLLMSDEGIVFSNYLRHLLGGGQVILHGAESRVIPKPSKVDARSYFSLPKQGRIALMTGFRTATKGWDIINRMEMPENWIVVTNSSRGYYNKEQSNINWYNDNKSNYSRQVIDLQRGYLNEIEHSILFHASDVLLLPYKVTAGSGVMFDGLAHGLPFIATNLKFFNEFANMGLGKTINRTPEEFTKAIKEVDINYNRYVSFIDSFKNKLKWNRVAEQHLTVYESIKKNRNKR
jgi:hypothetical protein